jgi:hypothetical protein
MQHHDVHVSRMWPGTKASNLPGELSAARRQVGDLAACEEFDVSDYRRRPGLRK